MKWLEIPIHDSLTPQAKQRAIRLNSLGSSYYFSTIVLGHMRFGKLHRYMCQQLEKETVRDVQEYPRDHFKSTIGAVTFPMWWSLSFTDSDEEFMRKLGYSDAWIQWMKRAHDQDSRTLIASETIVNARKIGSRIDSQYKSNSLFRFIFPEIIPRRDDRWNQDSMTHNRSGLEHHGEGTYDLMGVKAALQSRHYKRQVIDDPVGEKAIASDLVMEATVEWVRKLPGAFDSDPDNPNAISDQLFIGNRWSKRDLNSYLREWGGFNFQTHDAEGGCCPEHPNHGVPIFPEEWTMEKLGLMRAQFGAYGYSCQFRNNPIAPEAVRFKTAWLRYFTPVPWEGQKTEAPEIQLANSQQLDEETRAKWGGEAYAEAKGAAPSRVKMAMRHEVRSGEVLEDVRVADLHRVAILDPNHGGERGRARNAIVVLGYFNHPKIGRRLYLLDVWAKASSHEEWIEHAIGTSMACRGLAVKWRCSQLYIESETAGQQGWKALLQERVKRMWRECPLEATFSVRPLKTDRSANGKEKRIFGMESIYENGFFWIKRTNDPMYNCFLTEYEEYPNGSTVDILDMIGYSPQTWQPGSPAGVRTFIAEEQSRRARAAQSVGPAGY